jgi:hypothetical protein
MAAVPTCAIEELLIADAPGTVSTTGGRFLSGLFSTNDVNWVRHR